MLSNNFLALVITFLLAVLWLRLNDFAAHRGWISSQISRKLIHIGTGPIFVACWLLFDSSPGSRWIAASVPLIITLQFVLVGLGIMRDEAAVQAMSRTGDRREILQGPLFYGIVFVLLTIVYWYSTPIGIVALMLLCGGDGLADILGRRFGKTKLPWNNDKSWIGSLGMLLGGWFLSSSILLLYCAVGVFQTPFTSYLPSLLIISIAGAVVESLPIRAVDNITITLTAVLLGHIFF